MVRAIVEYEPEGAKPIPVIRVEVNTGLDVAVLHLQRTGPTVLPVGLAVAGAKWRVETRPEASDPILTGTVTDPRRRMRNQHGTETTLIQLLVEQELGDYQGYSGSPVTLPPEPGAPGRVLGVLVEQGLWRISPELGRPTPVANVLFAAPIDQVLIEFGLTEVTTGGLAGQIPLPVPFEVRRPDELNRVIDTLLANLTHPPPDGQLVGLVGMGGSGKSVLAAAAARDPRVCEAFSDGRFWLELGPDPHILQLQAGLAAALGDSTPITDVLQGRMRLSRLLAERRCLLVLDNVWDRTDLSAFMVVGPRDGLLVTTRDAAVLAGTTGITLDRLAPEAALQLLAGWTATPAGRLPTEAELVAQECGYLPLAVVLCGAMIAVGGHSWPQLLDLLRHANLDALQSGLVDYPHRSLAVALEASIDTLLPVARDRYIRLAIFNAEGSIPFAVLQMLWALDQQDTATLVGNLARKSLLRVEANQISLHDLQMDYLVRRAAPNLPAMHNQLLDAYSEQCHEGWATGPDDGYFHQHLARHLYHAGRISELQALLLDLDWMKAKLATGNIPGLLADYDTLSSDPVLRLVAGALRLSAHVLADNPGQLPSQLTGRLVDQHHPQLYDLLQRIRRWPTTPWLRALTASLTPPGGPLLRIITGHQGSVLAVAVSADGRRAVSGGGDGTVRVWDLDTGTAMRALTGHDRAVGAVAVSPDGRRAVSGGDDGTVRVWDLDTGKTVRTLTGHRGPVFAAAVSADGHRAVSGGEDGTVRVWDLDTGTAMRALTGHDRAVGAVAVSPDGRRAVSGGSDGIVRVWDLDTGTTMHVLTGHDSRVRAVAISADGRTAVSGGSDGTVRAWDLDTAAATHALTGHDGPVRAVAISANGRRAVSGGNDGTIRAWDLDAGTTAQALTGHDGPVLAVAISADGQTAVSGGSDGTVRAWDLDTAAATHALTGHDGPVRAVAISANGRRAVSGGDDGTIRAWDLDTGTTAQALTGHDGPVRAVAISADGRRAVSGGDDGTIRAWDLDTGTTAQALTGHDGRVRAVAISADGQTGVSGGSDGVVRLWNLDTGTAVRALTGHRGPVGAVAISAGGNRVVSGGDDGTVRAWDLDTSMQVASRSQRLRHLFARGRRDQISSLSVSADGRRAVAGGGAVRVWDLDTGTSARALTGHDGPVGAVAVSADGRRAVSGGWDGMVMVWDLATDSAVHAFTGHAGSVLAVAISADGRRAASGGRAVRVWDLAHGVELASFVSDSEITRLAVTPRCTRMIIGTSGGPVHLLELCPSG